MSRDKTRLKPVKILYFDIDGTVLRNDAPSAKPALGNGRFEELISRAGFDRVVCVGNMITVTRYLAEVDPDADPAEIVFRYLDGAFVDIEAFRARVVYSEDPEHRARHIDYAADWWYVDDMAAYYLELECLGDVLRAESGRRVFIPRPDGDGSGVAAWLTRAGDGGPVDA